MRLNTVGKELVRKQSQTGRQFPYIVLHTGTGDTHYLIPADLQQPIYSYLWPEAVDWTEMFYN